MTVETITAILQGGLLSAGAHTAASAEMCIQEALRLATGLDHGDRKLPCQCEEAADLCRRLNDEPSWSSPAAMTAATIPLGLASLGTAGRGAEVRRRLLDGVLRRVVPLAADLLADLLPAVEERTAVAVKEAARRCREGDNASALDLDLDALDRARDALALAALALARDVARAGAGDGDEILREMVAVGVAAFEAAKAAK